MKILFHGCSITWGDELEDRENERYSKLVSDKFDTKENNIALCGNSNCLLYTSPSPRDRQKSRMPSSA